MDTRGTPRDRRTSTSTPEVAADTAQIVELGVVGPPPRSSGTTALLVAGLVLAFGLGALVALQRPAVDATTTPAPTNPVAIATATTAPSPTPRPTASPRPTPGPWVWDAYDLRGFDPNTEVRRLWGFGNRFIALVVTTPGDGSGSVQHSLLVSTDGSAWSRALLPAPGFEVELGTVIDGTLWLVGQAVTDDGRRRREAWGTVDGAMWGRATGLESMTADAGAVIGIGFLPAGWVALCVRTGAEAELVLEVRRESATGVSSVTEIPLGMHEQPRAFVADGTSLLMLMKHTSDEGDEFFDIRHSVDGAAWSVADTFRPGAEILGVTMGPAGYVVVGEAPSGDGARPIGWRSVDGSAWEEASMPRGDPPPGQSTVGAFRVAATRLGYLAVSPANGMAWTSEDGLTWRAFNVWPAANDFIRDVAVVGDTVVALRANPGVLGFLRGTVSGMR